MRLLFLLIAFALLFTCAFAKEPQPSATHWMATVKVLKVFSAKHGDAIFRAYLIRWQNQEVIAQDTLATSDYHVGDNISVLVITAPFPKGRKPYGLLSFHIMPKI
jgi:hypothetical protein